MRATVPTIVGSKSDLDILRDSGMSDVFKACDVENPIHVISAHRNLESDLIPYLEAPPHPQAYVMGAGMAAALAGTSSGIVEARVPIIGVAFSNGSSLLFGLASVLSQICMPPGRPVAFAGIDGPGCYNAAILACQILAQSDPARGDMLAKFLSETNKMAAYNVALPPKKEA